MRNRLQSLLITALLLFTALTSCGANPIDDLIAVRELAIDQGGVCRHQATAVYDAARKMNLEAWLLIFDTRPPIKHVVAIVSYQNRYYHFDADLRDDAEIRIDKGYWSRSGYKRFRALISEDYVLRGRSFPQALLLEMFRRDLKEIRDGKEDPGSTEQPRQEGQSHH